MFCPNCGAQLPEGAMFCKECGKQISAHQTPQTPPPPPVNPINQGTPPPPPPLPPGYQQPSYNQQPSFNQQNVYPNNPKSGFSYSTLAIVILSVLVVAGAGYIFFGDNIKGMLGKNKENTAVVDSTLTASSDSATTASPDAEEEEPVIEDSEEIKTLRSRLAAVSSPTEKDKAVYMDFGYDLENELYNAHKPAIPDDFNWFFDYLKRGMPRGAQKMTDVEELVGLWKCLLLFCEPVGDFDSDRIEIGSFLLTVGQHNIEGKIGQYIMNDGESTWYSHGAAASYFGKWDSDKHELTLSGEHDIVFNANFKISDFFLFEGQQYGVGSITYDNYHTPAYFVITRP